MTGTGTPVLDLVEHRRPVVATPARRLGRRPRHDVGVDRQDRAARARRRARRSPGCSSRGSRRRGATSACSRVTLVALNVVYLPRRYVPMKYLLPGLFFLAVFGVYPVLYTAYASTTNYGTGFVLSQDQAIDQIQSQSIGPVEESAAFDVTPLRGLTARSPATACSTPRPRQILLGTDGGGRAARRARRAAGADDDRADVHRQRRRPRGRAARRRRHAARLPGRSRDVRHAAGDEGSEIRISGGQAFESRTTRVYDPETATITDTSTDRHRLHRPSRAVHVRGRRRADARASRPASASTTTGRSSPARVPAVRSCASWSGTSPSPLMSVVFSFALGLGLAMVFNDKRMRGRKIYRSLLIIPYALPGVHDGARLARPVQQDVRHQPVARHRRRLAGEPGTGDVLAASWSTCGWATRTCSSCRTGALQSIPTDLKEAAYVDGATGSRRSARSPCRCC